MGCEDGLGFVGLVVGWFELHLERLRLCLLGGTEAVTGCVVEETFIEMLRIFETLQYKGVEAPPRKLNVKLDSGKCNCSLNQIGL